MRASRRLSSLVADAARQRLRHRIDVVDGKPLTLGESLDVVRRREAQKEQRRAEVSVKARCFVALLLTSSSPEGHPRSDQECLAIQRTAEAGRSLSSVDRLVSLHCPLFI